MGHKTLLIQPMNYYYLNILRLNVFAPQGPPILIIPPSFINKQFNNQDFRPKK